LIATIAIIALLVVVIGVGIVNFTMSPGNTLTETSTAIETTSLAAVTYKTTMTQYSTVTLNKTVTATQSIIQSSTIVSKATVTSTSILTVTQNFVGASPISITSVILYGGVAATNSSQPTSSLLISFNDNSSSTYITSIILETPSGVPITAWDNSTTPSNAGNMIDFSSSNPGNNALAGSFISFFTFYPKASTAVSVPSGSSLQYSILFASGSMIQGTLTAQ
jgi:hypothetical protein